MDLNIEFHQNMGKLDVKTEILVMYAKQWISCAQTKFWSEILKFDAWIHKLKSSCKIMKKYVSIQNEVFFMIF